MRGRPKMLLRDSPKAWEIVDLHYPDNFILLKNITQGIPCNQEIDMCEVITAIC